MPREGISPTLLLGLLASRPARLLLSVRLGAGDDAPGSASKSYEVGLIRDLPFPDFTDAHQSHVEQLAKRAIELALERFHFADETSAVFVAPDVLLAKRQAGSGTFRNCGALGVTVREDRFIELAAISSQLDAVVATALGFSPDDHAVMHEELELALSELLGEHQVDDALFTRAYLTPTVSPAKNSLGYFISIVYIDHPVWRSHREEAKRGPPCEHRITRNEGAMVPFLLPCATTGLSSIAAWCGSGATPRGQQWPPA